MILTLHNFRCYRDKIFELPDKGLILLSGISGVGKTTILLAIYYVLYGRLKGQQVLSYGEKKSTVTLLYKDLTITRTKGPDSLILTINDKEYIDDDAQEIIDNKFGKKFHLTSYASQKMINTFFSLSSSDKTKFLEELTLQTTAESIEEIKNKVKIKLRETKDIFQRNIGELDFLEKELEQIENPEKIQCPVDDIKEFTKQWNNIKKEIEILTIEHNELKIKLQEQQIIKTKLNKEQEIIQELEKNIKELQVKKDELDFEDNIEDLEEVLEYLIKKREYILLTKKYEENKVNIDQLTKNELNDIQNELIVQQNKLQQSKKIDNLDCLKLGVKNLNELRNLDKQIQDKEKFITNQEDQTTKIKKLKDKLLNKNNEKKWLENTKNYICPSCNANLILYNNELQISSNNIIDIDDVVSKMNTLTIDITKEEKIIKQMESSNIIYLHITQEILQLNKSKSILQNKLKDFDITTLEKEYQLQLEQNNEYQKLNQTVVRLQKRLENKELSSTLQKLLLDNNKLKSKLDSIVFDQEIDCEYTEEELNILINEQKIVKSKWKELKNQIKSYKEKLEKSKKFISTLIVDTKDYYNTLQETDNLLNNKKETNKEYEQKNKDIKLYLEYKEKHKRYKNWIKKIKKTKQDEEKIKDKLNTLELFMKKIQETEYSMITDTITTMNYTINKYLEIFFNDRIMIEIKSYRETKKSIKPMIDITINYKNEDIQIDNLSFGENDRLILSTILSLNLLFGGNILILDEVVSSLDEALVNLILEELKKITNEYNKLIFVVCHQITESDFDMIIRL